MSLQDSKSQPTSPANPQTEPWKADDLQMLGHILEAQIQHYETTQATLERKRELIVAGQAQALQGVDRDLVGISRKVAQLEAERQKLQQQMGCPQWKLEQLIEKMPPPDASYFRHTRHRLLRVLQDTHRLNQDTKELLNLSLQWIHDTVQVIHSVIAPEGASYNARGSKQKAVDTGTTPIQSTVIHSA